MDDRFEVGARRAIARRRCRPSAARSSVPSARSTAAAEARRRPRVERRRCQARRRARQAIGVDRRNAKRLEPARGNRTCRVAMPPVSAALQHACSAGQLTRSAPPPPRRVFFSSIAIVSGPTPPGTGVSAPATQPPAGARRRRPPSRGGRSRASARRARRRTAPPPAPRSRDPVDADVDDRRARLARTPASRSPAGRSRRPGCRPRAATAARSGVLRVADRDRRVALQQQHRHRLADDLAAADDDGARAGDRRCLLAVEQLDHARRRARREMRRGPAPAGRR